MCKALSHIQDGFKFKIGDGNSSFWFSTWLAKIPISLQVPFVDVHDLNLKICDVWKDDKWDLDML